MDTFIDLEREKGRQREREREKHRSVASCTHPDQGSNPQPRYVPWQEIESASVQCTGRCANQPTKMHWHWPGQLNEIFNL